MELDNNYGGHLFALVPSLKMKRAIIVAVVNTTVLKNFFFFFINSANYNQKGTNNIFKLVIDYIEY